MLLPGRLGGAGGIVKAEITLLILSTQAQTISKEPVPNAFTRQFTVPLRDLEMTVMSIQRRCVQLIPLCERPAEKPINQFHLAK